MILAAAVVFPGGLGDGAWTRDCRSWIWGVALLRVERRFDFDIFFFLFSSIGCFVVKLLDGVVYILKRMA